MDKMFSNIGAEIGIMRMVGCKDREKWQKIGTYMIKYKEKRGR
jgi:hypothetical protein